MPDSLSSHGTLLSVELTPGGAFTEVGELGDLTPPGLMRNEFDASTQNVDIDSWITGILRREPVTAPVFFNRNNASHAGLRALLIANTLTGFKVDKPDGDEWVGSGFVRQITDAAPVDGIQAATLTVRLSGPFYLNGVLVA